MGGPLRAFWDAEAGVWVASSDDVPGVVTEAPGLDLLKAKLSALIPELLAANGILKQAGLADRKRFQLSSRMVPRRAERAPGLRLARTNGEPTFWGWRRGWSGRVRPAGWSAGSRPRRRLA
ncbi:MAG: DUF1902 domain-containing protein [Terriglobales bacterium]